MQDNMILFEINDLCKDFGKLHVLDHISTTISKGEVVVIVGPSGSGKSTLMNLIGVLDRPTSGSYYLDGIDVGSAHDNDLSDIRNQKIGFVFQTYNLIPKTNALRNVELPMLYAGVSKAERRKRAMELLELVEMSDRASHLPEELSEKEDMARIILPTVCILLFLIILLFRSKKK